MTRINTNVQSLIARRGLELNTRDLNQALERLSTGLRINRGSDDPAGLIASETLRSSIEATNTAIDNAIRADTVMAIAEGGLQEISSLLLELESLIGESANTAGLTESEIAANQLQVDSILQSINRIAEQTAFGDIKLLNGNFDYTTSGVNINESTGATVDQIDRLVINSAKIPEGAFRQVTIDVVAGSEFAYVSATPGGLNGTLTSGTVTIQVQGNFGSETLTFASGTSSDDIVSAINASSQLTGVSAVVSGAGTAGSPDAVILTSTGYGSDAFVSVSILDNTAALLLPGGEEQEDFGVDGTITVNGANAIVNGLDASVRTASLSLDLTLSESFGSTDGGSGSFEILGGGAQFSIGPDVTLSSLESIGLTEVSTANLGSTGTGFLASLGTGLENDLNGGNFAAAQRVVRAAIDQVATLRGRIGAFQKNTLTTTENSLSIAKENLTAAESAIRDADFAVEVSNLTRAQILVQSSLQTLTIANSQPQNALSLLG